MDGKKTLRLYRQRNARGKHTFRCLSYWTHSTIMPCVISKPLNHWAALTWLPLMC